MLNFRITWSARLTSLLRATLVIALLILLNGARYAPANPGLQYDTQEEPNNTAHITLEDAPEQVTPRKILTRDNLITAAQIGIGVAVDLNPSMRSIKTAFDMTGIVLDESVKAVDFRNNVIKSHLLLVSQEAKELIAIKERDGNLESDKAQAILQDLRRGYFAQDSTGMFLAKSVFSGRMAYGVVSQTANYFAMGWVGENTAKLIPTGDRVERMWIGKRSFVRLNTDIQWKHLTVLGRQSKLLTDALQKVLLVRIGRAIGRYGVESFLDQKAEEILRDHPSMPEAATYLRVDMMVQPQLAQAIPAVPEVPLMLPPVVRVQQDPVVRAANVQQQIIEQQHYQVSDGSSHSVSGNSRQSPPEEHHPTHSIPSSISLPGGSWTGGSGSSLFSRY